MLPKATPFTYPKAIQHAKNWTHRTKFQGGTKIQFLPMQYNEWRLCPTLPTRQCWTYAPLCSIGKTVRSCATLKYCSRSPFFCVQYCLPICSRCSPMERNFLNLIFYSLGLGQTNISTFQNFKRMSSLFFYFVLYYIAKRYDDILLIAIYRTCRERRRK